MPSKYKKLIVDGKPLKVFLIGSTAADEAETLAKLKGIEIESATSSEFLDYYEKINGRSCAKPPERN
jgi:hypothetical protein